MRIAILDSDPAQADFICAALTPYGCVCRHFTRGRALLLALRRETFDLLILDHALPDIAGFEVLRKLREIIAIQVPVIFLTSFAADSDETSTLNAGADDYLVKPVGAGLLRARVSSVVRRARAARLERGDVAAGAFEFDPVARSVTRNGVPVHLTTRQYKLALLFYQHLGTTLSREHILDLVWKDESDVSTRTIDTQICRLRSKLALAPESGYRLASVHGRGYRLDRLQD
jgi:DNA-binding response OmpR family regulator